MAIIYSYPQINLSSISADDLMIISDMNADGRPTKSLTLKNLADFVTSTGTGTGTTNAIIKWSDGPAGLLGDSIMNEDVDKINLNGILRIAESNNRRLEIKYGTDSDTSHLSSSGGNASQIIGRAGDLIIKNRARTRDIVFQADNGEYNGTVDTYFRLDGSMADIGTSSYFTRWGDNSYIAFGDSAGTYPDFYMGHGGGGTRFKNHTSNLSIESKGGINIENESGGSGHINITQSVTNEDIEIRSEGDIKLKGSGNHEYFRVDSGVGEAIFYKQAQVPLVPTANAHATSKQYVDTQIASIPAGLVFQGNWDANANSPTLASGTGTVGNYYVVSVPGNTNLDGITDWEVGDWAVFVEVGGVDKWDKIDQTFVQGSGVSGNMTYWNGINSIKYDASTPFVYSEVGGGGQPPGRLGLGTSSPNFKMDIAGGDLRFEDNNGIRFGGTGSANTNWRIYTTGSNSGTWKLAGGSDFVTVDRSATSAAATHGKVTFNKYGSGNFTGTAVYNLSVDANGVIVETTGGGAGGPYVPYMSGSDQIARTEGASTYNTSLGFQAAQNLTSGTDNTLIGGLAGDALTTGVLNVAVGKAALSSEDTGSANVAIGHAALMNQNYNGSGYNTAIGHNAGQNVSTGIRNTLIGGLAGDALTTGLHNVAVGYNALSTEDEHGTNVAVGVNALQAQNAGADAYNVAVGYDAGYAVTTGLHNTLIGGLAADALTTGDENIAIGYNALSLEDTGNKNIAIGSNALSTLNYNGDAWNVAIGHDSGKLISNGVRNVLVGAGTGDALTSGNYNTAVGHFALSAEDGHGKNTAVGYTALYSQNAGADAFNTAVGFEAGLEITTGVENVL